MKTFATLLIGFLVSLPVHAQIKIDNLPYGNNGNIAVGSTLPEPGTKLRSLMTTSSSNGYTVGLKGEGASTATRVYGVLARGNGQGGGTWSYGVGAEASEASYNYGLKGYAYASSGQAAYGVYGSAGGSTKYAGYFSGNVTVTGTFSNPSDERLKENVTPLGSGLARSGGGQDVLGGVLSLRPVQYRYRTSGEFAAIGLPEGDQFGLIAQEVQEVFPSLVSNQVHPATETESGELVPAVEYLSVNYIEMIPLLIEAIQTQQKRISELERMIEVGVRR